MKQTTMLRGLFSMMLLSLFFVASAQDKVLFISHPSPDPNGTNIYFSYEGDLWRVSSDGGEAVRITAMRGEETHPRVSPDGQWLAFSGSQDGNANLYVMPLSGGEIRQLTYHDASDEMSSWSWDSKHILFSSSRYNSTSMYKVPLEGGTPQRMFDHYFNIPHDLVTDPNNSQKVYFTDTWESSRQVQRKRYKGAFNPDIKSYDFTSGEYQFLTDWEGKDLWPSITKNGQLYFASDEGNGEYNLYTLENGSKKPLTSFESSVWYPQVNASGTLIAYVRDYQLEVFDIASSTPRKLEVRMGMNSFLENENRFNTATNISAFDISPDQKKMAFISRGLLFVSDIKGKFIRQIPTDPKERALEVKWHSDNDQLIFTQTQQGWKNLYLTRADGSTDAKALTQTTSHNRQLEMDKERTQLAWYAGRDQVMHMDLGTMAIKTLAQDELWGFQNGGLHFSPDGKWLAYTATLRFEKEIMLIRLADGKKINLSHTVVSETDPFFSPDGKHVYFSTDPYNPSYPTGGGDQAIYRIALQNEQGPLRTEAFEELFVEEKKEKEKEKASVEVDENDLHKRWERITGSGSQRSPFVVSKGDKTYILYLSNEDGQGNTLWKTVKEEFESDKTEKFKGTRGAVYGLTAVGEKLYGLMGGDIHTINYEAGTVEKISINHNFTRELRNEFEQMFFETWANMSENFYDGTFRGLDWERVRDRYASYLPHVINRAQLRTMINHMLGELNSSHLGFNSFGQEENTSLTGQSLTETGILFDNENPYLVDRIVDYSEAYALPEKPLKGDKLVAIDGVEIDPKENRFSYFLSASRPGEIKLSFERGAERYTITTKTQSSGALRTQLYDEWMAANQAYVDEKSGKRIAYIHMKNMGGGELNRFLEEMANEAEYRDALILDLRNNTGGNVHDKVLQTLSQKKYSYWQYRDGGRTTQPNFTNADKPIVLLQNEQSLSDAEMTANGFKALGLGQIIGTESYRWIIFTSSFGLVDGSNHRMPAWGVYDLEGNDLEMTGVKPDIFVPESFKDRLLGQQPQLDRAIEEIMKKLK